MTSAMIFLKKFGDRRMRRQRHLSTEMFRRRPGTIAVSNDSRTFSFLFFVGKSRNSEVAPPTSSSGAPWIISPLTKNKNPKKNGWQNSRHSSRRPRSIQTGSSSFLLDWKIMGKRSASENTRKHLGGPWPPFFNLFAPNNCIPIWTCRWSTSKCTQHSPSLKSYLDGQHFIPTPSK